MIYPQADDFVAILQSVFAIEAPIQHRAAIHELGTGGEERPPHGVGIVDARFELKLFAGNRHENSARSTAAVSPRVSKTCVAPAARSAAAL